MGDVVWHVSWSVPGNILAVSGGDNKVSLWKETLDEQWQCISDVSKGASTVIIVYLSKKKNKGEYKFRSKESINFLENLNLTIKLLRSPHFLKKSLSTSFSHYYKN